MVVYRIPESEIEEMRRLPTLAIDGSRELKYQEGDMRMYLDTVDDSVSYDYLDEIGKLGKMRWKTFFVFGKA